VTYGELDTIENLLNDIRKGVDEKDFLKVLRKFKADGKGGQILDEFEHRYNIKL
jgi:hypothetical protein